MIKRLLQYKAKHVSVILQGNKYSSRAVIRPKLGSGFLHKVSNEYPLEPHFYIVKLGFAGVYLILLKHTLWVLVRTASAYPQCMF